MKSAPIEEDYHSLIEVNATAEEAFENINQVWKWWATNVTGCSQNLNDVFTVRFGKTFSTFRVVELVAGKKILWQVVDSFLPLFKNVDQWNDTKLLWEISDENNHTQIRFTHIGLTPQVECYGDCNKGWNFYTRESLFKLLTTGKGLPGTGIFANISSGHCKYEGLLFFKSDPLPDYAADHIFLDVKETDGEQVISIYTAGEYNKESFNVHDIKGEYFMIIDNTPLFKNISPLNDILEMMNHKT